VAWVAARALALATLILLTRALRPADLGAFFAALAAGLLGATLATGGLPDATTRTAASATGEGLGRGDLKQALVRFGAVCPAIFVLLFVIVSSESGAMDWSLLMASVLLAVTQGGTLIIGSIFRARGQAGLYALVTSLLASVGRTVIASAALVFTLGAGPVLWAFAVLNVAVIIGTWRAAGVRDLPPTRSEAEGEGALHLGGAVWSLLSNLDVVVVGVVLGARGAGTYGATMRLAEFSIQFLIAITVLYLPEVTRLAVAGRRDALRLLYRTSSRWSAMMTLLVAGVGFIAAPSLAKLLFPHNASVTTTILRLLFSGYAVHGALGLAYGTAVALGMYREIRGFALVALPLLLAITVAFTALWGLIGAASATLTGYLVFSLWWAFRVKSVFGATPFDRLYVRAVLACGLSWVVAAIVAALTGGARPAVSLVATALAGFAMWSVLVLWAGVLSSAELRAVGRLRGRAMDSWRASSGRRPRTS
jgi:O-antigen/teichoic acid export membrane protein